MFNAERLSIRSVSLPRPKTEAYFPKVENSAPFLTEVLKRAGENNLVYALEYGSHVVGDASPTSMHDIMIIVKDAKKFHRKNMEVAPNDYKGSLKSLKWHTFLNKFGFNFYHTTIKADENEMKVKYAVISEENFIKGCHGTLAENEKKGLGSFGLYVAGRVQKTTLRPFFKVNKEQTARIEEAINAARIDGVWLAMSLLKDKFSFNRLIVTYVALSYLADLRPRQANKIMGLVHKNIGYYKEMLNPIIDEFVNLGLIERDESNQGYFKKIKSMPEKEARMRLISLKPKTAFTNYVKNLLAAGPYNSISYAIAKIKRSRAH